MRVSVRLAAGANSAAGCLAIAIAHTHIRLAACVFSSPKCAHGCVCVCVFGDEIATPYIARHFHSFSRAWRRTHVRAFQFRIKSYVNAMCACVY